MKYYLLLLMFTIASKLSAVNYYISNSGNDSNNGISPESAIQTIAHLNTLLSNLQAGDQILFNKGDVFYGEVVIPSGTEGTIDDPIIIDSYGSGEMPVISGSVEVSKWQEESENIWKASLSAEEVTQVFCDDKRLKIARIPNTAYYDFTSADTNGVADGKLAGEINYWAGATILFHLNEYWWEEAEIDSSTGEGYIYFDYDAENINEPIVGSGYFIQDKFELLDTVEEWYFDSTAQTLYLYSETDPNTQNIRASVEENGLQLFWPWQNKYITVQNIEFREQAANALVMRGSEGLTVKNCYIHDVGQYGLLMSSDYESVSTDAEIAGNIFHDCMANGIYTFNVSQSAVTGNEIKRSGIYPVTGGATEASGQCGMRLWFGDSLTISCNSIDSSGNCGISMETSYSLIEKNIIDHSMLLLSDGAAFYNDYGGYNTYRNNIFRNTEGNMDASAPDRSRYTKELYFDAGGEYGTIVENNTLVGGAKSVGIGITPNTNTLTIQNNVIYHTYRGIELMNYDPQGQPVTELNITNNSICTNVENGHPYYVNAWNGLSGPYSVCDSNYLCNPYSDTIVEHRYSDDILYLTMSEWQSQSGVDEHSVTSYHQWEYPIDSSFIIINESDTEKTYCFSGKVVDLDNNHVSSISLAPYTSKILIGSEELTGIEESENKDNGFELYPNPADDRIYIACTGQSKDVIFYRMIDESGRICKQGKLRSQVIDVSGLSPKIYTVILEQNKQTVSEKVLIK